MGSRTTAHALLPHNAVHNRPNTSFYHRYHPAQDPRDTRKELRISPTTTWPTISPAPIHPVSWAMTFTEHTSQSPALKTPRSCKLLCFSLCSCGKELTLPTTPLGFRKTAWYSWSVGFAHAHSLPGACPLSASYRPASPRTAVRLSAPATRRR